MGGVWAAEDCAKTTVGDRAARAARSRKKREQEYMNRTSLAGIWMRMFTFAISAGRQVRVFEHISRCRFAALSFLHPRTTRWPETSRRPAYSRKHRGSRP